MISQCLSFGVISITENRGLTYMVKFAAVAHRFFFQERHRF